ncbi:MAG: phage tail tape measure protein [Deltaproteobacteria bacterium HGW-Deltaproteobacteria-15]|nr:MAG: phage tail tape measure protein [Deltaproteobacteria bacterium HGW-Deltaproteobacteria-15]
MESIFKLGIFLSVLDKVSGPAGRIAHSMDTLKGKAASLGPAFDKFKTYGIRVATAGALMLHMLGGAVGATEATQKALGELASVGVKDLSALERAGAQFSNQWAGTSKSQFISAAYDIKSGISSLTDEGVAEFTKLAAITGKATKSTTAEMTSLFATGYGIYKDMYGNLSDMQFGEVFSAGIAASVQAFKTTGSGMAQAISTLGATATTAKVPLEEQLAILGMLQATMSGSEAGTKYKALMQAAAGAGDKLKLSFTDANNQLLSMPEILTKLRGKYGDTLDAMEKMEIQKAFGTQEAVAVIDLLYGKIGALTENTRGLSAATRQGSGFTESMAKAMNNVGDSRALMWQQVHNLVEAIGKQLIPVMIRLYEAIGAGAVWFTKFAEKHQALVRVAVIALGVIAGLAFALGTLAAALGAIGLLTPSVISGIGMVSGAYAALRANILGMIPAMRRWLMWQSWALKTYLYQQGGIRRLASSINRNMLPAIWAWVRGLAAGLLPAISGAAAAVWGFTTALFANPITWVVIGVAALVAAFVLLYKHCEPVRNVILAVGRALKTAGEFVLFFVGFLAGGLVAGAKAIVTILSHPVEFVQFLGDAIGRVIDWVTGKFDGLSPALKTAAKLLLSFVFPPLAIAFNWDAIMTGVSAALEWIRGLVPRFMEAGSALFDAITAGIKSKLTAPVEAVKGVLGKIANLIPHSDAKEGPLSGLTTSGRAIMETLGAGVSAAAPGLHKTMAGALAGAALTTSVALSPMQMFEPPIQDLSAKAAWESQAIAPPKIPDLAAKVDWSAVRAESAGKPVAETKRSGGVHIASLSVTLPGVTDAGGFVEELKRLVEGFDA